jgi:hypothetical protein
MANGASYRAHENEVRRHLSKPTPVAAPAPPARVAPPARRHHLLATVLFSEPLTIELRVEIRTQTTG